MEVVYDDWMFSFTYTKDTAPRYYFASDGEMYLSGNLKDDVERNDWVQQFGKFEEVKLTYRNFDRYLRFFAHGEAGPVIVLRADSIRRNTEKAWRIDIENEMLGSRKNRMNHGISIRKQFGMLLALIQRNCYRCDLCHSG